ncbi:MAG: DUF1622 domain-containing protein [Propionibacteriales bacterium]|nr:DUF1622 domain-containing protein [Propionibacteriales bacterium]
MDFQQVVELVGQGIDAVGVAVIVIGALAATAIAAARLARGNEAVYGPYRQHLGRSILLGLELLVGADIIRTVAVKPTFTSAGVLGLIVVIRTFLSLSIELEITGRWPWQKKNVDDSAAA